MGLRRFRPIHYARSTTTVRAEDDRCPIRVDRATPWGNPFVIGRDGGRATVIARYRDHYLPCRPVLLARLGELRGKALGCWCAPLACHGEVLAEGVSGAAAGSHGARPWSEADGCQPTRDGLQDAADRCDIGSRGPEPGICA
jgi:Domain of unknown function (DUF4326)